MNDRYYSLLKDQAAAIPNATVRTTFDRLIELHRDIDFDHCQSSRRHRSERAGPDQEGSRRDENECLENDPRQSVRVAAQ